MIIEEDYVSFEIAKLLKEKGFDELCKTAYETITSKHEVEQCATSNWFKLNQVKRPTLQMAMKWLREVHCLFIDIDWDTSSELTPYFFLITDMKTKDYIRGIKKAGDFSTYEEACEAAIKYCLENLI